MTPRIIALATLLASSALCQTVALLFAGEWRFWLLASLFLSAAIQWILLQGILLQGILLRGSLLPSITRVVTERRELLWLTYVTFTSYLFSGVVHVMMLTTSNSSPTSAALASFLALAASAGIGILGVGIPHTRSTLIYVALQILTIKALGTSTINLLSEEAYYWKYAESLNYGYLDHPPMVAFLIRLGELLLGTTEFGIRFGAILSWGLLVCGAWLLSREATGRRVFVPIFFLCSILPFTTSVGFFITPDTPLAVAWIFGLHFLYRVLFLGKEKAWWGVGACLGFGLLSKYPMVLFGATIPLFLLLDAQSRKWFTHPLPYCAAGLALAIFSPVILWNYQHDWASFAFQSSRRFSADSEFSLHLWGVFVFLSATPLAVLVLVKGCRLLLTTLRTGNGRDIECGRFLLFSLLWCAVPLAAFGYASLTQEVKINWLGPAFLSLLPLLACSMQTEAAPLPQDSPLQRELPHQKGWFGTGLVVSALLHGALFYVAIGIPYMPTPKALKKFLGWSELAAIVRERETQLIQSDGVPPIVVGGDSHYVASELGFYRAKYSWVSGDLTPIPTQGRALFDAHSLMYRYWSLPQQYLGKTCIVVSRSEGDVADSKLGPFFTELLPPERVEILREGKPFVAFFLRIGRGYRRAPGH